MTPASKQITHYHLTNHAKSEMARRGVTEDEVKAVLSKPEQWEAAREGREIYQAKFQRGEPPKTYLLRVFVDIDREPPDVVTVYRTSKVDKYWRDE